MAYDTLPEVAYQLELVETRMYQPLWRMRGC